MPAFNQLTLIGNLTRDAELRFTQSGKAVCNGGVATNRKWKSESGETKEDVCFLDFTVWGMAAETFAKFTRKGSAVFLQGNLKQETWDDHGDKRTKLFLNVETFQFLDRKDEK